jgi:branched-chain amino acid transport system permease protein
MEFSCPSSSAGSSGGIGERRRTTINQRKTIDILKIMWTVFNIAAVVDEPHHQFLSSFPFAPTTTWNLVGGFAGVLPLGHSAYVGIGAYTSTVLFITWGISPWAGMWVGGLIAAIVGAIIGIPTLKLRGAYFALSTMAFGEGVRVLVENTMTVGPCVINGPRESAF